MITKEKISIYKFYAGDTDGWARMGSDTQKELMRKEDWLQIDEQMQYLTLLENNLIHSLEANQIIEQYFDNAETWLELLNYFNSLKKK